MSQDPYCYPGTTVLINLLGTTDPDLLRQFERASSADRLASLRRKPLAGGFDLAHLRLLHHALFEDVYPFAGQLRTVNISKGGSPFCSHPFLVQAGSTLLEGLRRERHLQGLAADQFVDRAAYYLGEINALHPFREGNGRTQREFLRTLGLQVGFELDWSRTDERLFLEGSIRSFKSGDVSLLVQQIGQALTSRTPSKALQRSFERAKGLAR